MTRDMPLLAGLTGSQVAGGRGVAGSSYVRWSNIPSIVENIRNISFTLPLPLCNIIWHIFPMQKSYEIPDSDGFLWDPSWGAPAEFQHVKWSREIKFHRPARTWFPLSPHSLSQLLSSLYAFQELMDCGCMEEIIYYPNTLCFCSLYLHCSRRGVPDIPTGPISSPASKNFQTDKLMTCEWRKLMSNTLLTLDNYCQNAREKGI